MTFPPVDRPPVAQQMRLLLGEGEGKRISVGWGRECIRALVPSSQAVDMRTWCLHPHPRTWRYYWVSDGSEGEIAPLKEQFTERGTRLTSSEICQVAFMRSPTLLIVGSQFLLNCITCSTPSATGAALGEPSLLLLFSTISMALTINHATPLLAAPRCSSR